MMDIIKKRMRIVFWLFFIIFLLLFLNLSKIILIEADEIRVNSYNKRLFYVYSDVIKGTVYDSQKNVLAETKTDESDRWREYPTDRLFGQTVGYMEFGGFGVEKKYNFWLYGVNNELIRRIESLNGGELRGNDLLLTYNSGLQKHLYDALKGFDGAAVAIEPSTGKILAMVSLPGITPSPEGLETAKNSEPGLINKASQGLYEPGSTFKVVTALAYLEKCEKEGLDYRDFTYKCRGIDTTEDSVIHCFDERVHGEVNLESAFSQSCNIFFAKLGEELGQEALYETAERLLFNKAYSYPLEYSVSSFALSQEADLPELHQTAFGQGKTLTTPLHMVMIAASVANGGVMMKPYVLDCILSGEKTIKKFLPEVQNHVISAENAEKLAYMMGLCVSEGTGRDAAKKFPIAGKTGTAENPGKGDHSWFIGYAPSDDPKIAIAVFLDQKGTSRNAARIAGNAMKYYLDENE